MNEPINSLNAFRVRNRITQKELAAFLGCTPSAISNFESSSRRINFKYLLKIKRNDKGWNLSDLALEYPEMFAEVAKEAQAKPASNTIPVVPTDAMAGGLAEYINDGVTAAQCEQIASPVAGATCAIRVHGESMMPKYPSGSIVLLKKINPDIYIDYGKTFVLDTENGPMIKEIHHCEDESRVMCVSINPDPKYHPFEISKSSIFGWYKVMMAMNFE